MELAWYTDAWFGAMGALHVDDFNREGECVAFYHQPREGTPFQNGLGIERVVCLPVRVTDVVDE